MASSLRSKRHSGQPTTGGGDRGRRAWASGDNRENDTGTTQLLLGMLQGREDETSPPPVAPQDEHKSRLERKQGEVLKQIDNELSFKEFQRRLGEAG